jgi:ABC-type multidrug transport system permease subunit
MDIFPKNCPIGLDKLTIICYNTIMTNNNNNSRKENKMLKRLFYSHLGSDVLIIAGCIAMIIAGSVFGTWALLQTI